MPIVTLTTDYGNASHSVAALKGQLLSKCKGIQLVDISHDVKPFDNIGGAYIAKNAAVNFPVNSLHLIVVNIKEGNNRYLIVVRKGQMYICPDNGMVGLMFPKEDFEAFVMPGLEPDFSYQDLTTAFCGFWESLLAGNKLNEIAKKTSTYFLQVNVQAIVEPDQIRGSVLYVDDFGNLVSNISKKMFAEFVQDKPFAVNIRSYKVYKVSKHYSEVDHGQFLCLFNDAGYLEFAQNRGNVSKMLNVKHGSNFLVELA